MSENVAEEEILESYDNVKIIRKKGEILPIYLVAEKHLNEEEEKIVENPRTLIKDYSLILKDLEVIQSIDEKESFIRKIIEKHLDESNFRIEHKEELIEKIMDYNFLGYCKLGPLMRDDKLEEIMVNSINTPIFVFHRRYGMCKTNLKFETKHEIYEFIEKVSSFVGRKIDQDNPLLDGHLIDGSRINIAIPPAAPSGPSITIRKFRKSPYTIIDLIARKTISIELAAFLWLCVEGFGIHPCNILIAGSSGAGKTTLLNALAMFIPQEERVVTVEDTLELNFDFLENWVPLEAVPSLTERKRGEITMDVLVENTLRMRPDRVIVGEIRGREAEPFFVAMDIGLNGSMATIHSNNAKETATRLINPPMSVPHGMIPLLHLVVVVNRYHDKEKGLYRRVIEVGEIAGLEGKVVQIGQIYRWDSKIDKITRTEYPILLLDKMQEWFGLSKAEINKEIYRRGKLLEYMLVNKIHRREDVIPIFQEYHKDPKGTLKKYLKNN